MSKAVTDTARIKKTDPGDPEVCNIYTYHKLFSSQEELDFVSSGCKKAEIGCLACKKIITKNIANELEPIRDKYHEYLSQPDLVYNILSDGNRRANAIATEVMQEVYEKVGL